MTLNKRYLRNIKNNLSFYISITLLTALVVYMYVAISAAYSKERDYIDEKVAETNREDGQFTLYNDMSEDEIAEYEDKWNVEIEKQYYVDTAISDDVSVRVFRASEKVDKYVVSVGRDIEADNEILINQLFAEANDISIGDKLTLELNGISKTFEVVGYPIRTDYLFCLKNSSDVFSVFSEFGIGVLSESAFDDFVDDSKIGVSDTYYAIVYHEDNEMEVRKDLYKQKGTSSYMASEINNRLQVPTDQLDELEVMASVILPISIFFVIILIAVVLGRKVKNEKKMIGILNALGMTKFELARHYSIFGIIPGLIGSIIGTILGNVTAGAVIDMMIEGKIEALPLSYNASVSTCLIAIGLPTLCYGVAVFVTTLITIRGNSIELIKGSSKSYSHKNLRMSNSGLSFRTKYKLRAIFGNFGRTLTLLFGVAIGGILLAFMYACIDSLYYYVDYSVDETGGYEYEYFLNTIMIEPEEGSSLEKGEVGFLSTSFNAENKNEIVTVMGIDDTTYLNLKSEDGKTFDTEDDKYYISSMGALVYGVEAGDKLSLYDINSLEEYSITVDGVFENGSQILIVTSNNTLCEMMDLEESLGMPLDGMDVFTGVMSDHKMDFDSGIVIKEVSKESFKKQIKENVVDGMEDILGLVLALAAGLMVMIIYLMVNVLLSENTITISMLKVLGYQDKEINSIITHIYHVVVAIGIVLGLYFGYLLIGYNFRQSASTYNCYIPNVMYGISVVKYLVIAVLSYVISLLLLGRKIRSVSMVESLKDTRA
ncbi:MAG: ABC transporter permease [Lachnospiraceae bacterium]|nr:ABC transporter permease [Lachnospiraceae bacterium]